MDPGLAGYFDEAVASRLGGTLSRSHGRVWVTDADGTLWREDIGEAFLRWLADEGALVSQEAEGVDVWASYEARVAEDKAAGYAWAVQVMAGMQEDELARRAEAFARTFVPTRAFRGMRRLVDAAREAGCEPWIVSASNQWIITAAAPLLGIDPARAVGVRLAVRSGRLTDEVLEPFTYRAGKVEAIRRFVGAEPLLVSGDSEGDLEMLEAAEEASLVIACPDASEPPPIVRHARERGWLLQTFGPSGAGEEASG